MGRGDPNQKNLPWEGYGHLLEQQIIYQLFQSCLLGTHVDVFFYNDKMVNVKLGHVSESYL